MKKLLVLLSFVAFGISAFAQKSYINIFARSYDSGISYHDISLSGDVPHGMSSYHSFSKIGDILNELSQKGYEVEFMSATEIGTTSKSGVYYLLSKKSSDSVNAIQRVQADPNEEVTEVARYNLQGMPIGKNEKGVQIVVYSNYTTKTIIVE